MLQNLTTSHQSVAFELRCLARGSQRLFFVSVFLHTEILTHLAAGFLLNFINYGPGRSCSMQQNGQAAPNRCFSGHPVVFIFARSSMAVENTPLCHCGKAEGFRVGFALTRHCDLPGMGKFAKVTASERVFLNHVS